MDVYDVRHTRTCLAALLRGADAAVAELLSLAYDRGVVVRAPVARANGLAAYIHRAIAAGTLGGEMVGDGGVAVGASDVAARWAGCKSYGGGGESC